ncbi:MAG: hypothetical protein LC803_00720 [Acidobacteria bacterium]|nr:hypothetical protein [Acidobacteriota bacterium]
MWSIHTLLLFYNKQLVSPRALQTETRAYRWLVRNAERFGFCPYFYEPWHWEYCAP